MCQSVYDKNNGNKIDTIEEDMVDAEINGVEDLQVQIRTIPVFWKVHVLVLMALVHDFCTQ